ncbi:MAG TPA: sugar phosphate isomerase/epimerase family protein [Candidatus Eisenbacteria bacterium]|nr:sugar phosphate isomerase/epimerase family protein [Candidatus Eisenbacteria bacterium]
MSYGTRRQFVIRAGKLIAASGVVAGLPNLLRASGKSNANAWKSPFRVAVITDEISQDFDRACFVAAREFGMQWVEVRGLWNKNLMNLTSSEIAQAQGILKKYELRVTDIASPLFKVDWPGAPASKYSPKRDQFNANFGYEQQNEVFEKCVEAAKAFGTDRVRGFDFWRLDDQAPYRRAIDAKLQEGATQLARHNIIFVLENEYECNTATGAEAARTLAAVRAPNFMLNWDPGNAAARGEIPYPNGWNLLPKQRIGHCHCKDIILKPDGSGFEWAPVGKGTIDWIGQFRALKQAGYHLGVSLETHWRDGTPEESSRQSWAGMKTDLQKAGALS